MSEKYDILTLLEMSGERLPMTEDHLVSIRADLVDVTPQKPHGLDYGVFLNLGGERVLGFDNKHSYDGAEPDEPFDHEHRMHLRGQTFRYDFKTGSTLISDFFDRVDAYVDWYGRTHGTTLRFLD
jgi:hypothetical protein